MLDSTLRSRAPAIPPNISPSRAISPSSTNSHSDFEDRSSGGFTLIELLVVIAIISILASILLPVFAQAREKSRQALCSSNLMQFSEAWLMYADDFDETAVLSYNKEGRPGEQIGNADDAWDFKKLGDGTWTLGMLGPYTTSGQLSACPDFAYPPGYIGRPYDGYAYNATYIGGDLATNEGDFPAANLAQIVYPSETALFADGGYGASIPQPENFLRAPSDTTFYYGGLVAFRHNCLANVAYADGHVKIARDNFPYDPKYPEFGGLSKDDSAYGPGMKPCSAYAH